MTPISDIAFTPTIKRAQQARGSRKAYERRENSGWWTNEITPVLREFLAERDSIYLATANSSGQPYVQHRGGQKGFIKVLDERTLAFADFVGNAQYVSLGNLEENDQAFIFAMDYINRTRFKIWGRARFVEGDDTLTELVTDAKYPGRVERVLVFRVEAWDRNCPQHITPRLTAAAVKVELEARTQALQTRIDTLEAENERLRQQSLASTKISGNSQ
jgi:predicted pyridoxine 5'-phosphate oxidase superfamily flavin-nucleotide-binding protein